MFGVAVDNQGNIYVASRFGHRIRRISPDGEVATLAGTGIAGYADGSGSEAQFNFPKGMAIDVAGNMYVADVLNHRIRVVRPDGMVSTLAGDGTPGYLDGPAAQAQFDRPSDVVLNSAGVLYVADAGNNRIRAISPDGVVTTLAGSGEQGFVDGPPGQAQFNGPDSLAVDEDGDIYASDSVGFEIRSNHAIRRITPEGVVTTLAGTGQPGRIDGQVDEAGFFIPVGLDVDTEGNLYVVDGANHRIRVITPQGMVYTVAGNGRIDYGDGPGSEAAFFFPAGIGLDDEGHLYVTDLFSNRVRIIDLPHTLVAAPPGPTPDPFSGQNVIKIGFVDETERAGIVSATTRNAAQLAIDEANSVGGVTVGGTRFTFALVRAQDWFQPPDAGAQAAARALIDQGVVAVVGHVLSENSIAGAEVYGPAGMVMVSAVSSDPRVTQAGWSTVYRVTSNDAFMAPEAARMTFDDLGIRRVALRGESDPHTLTTLVAWQQAFEALGGLVLGRFESAEGEAGFSDEILTQMEAFAPEAVILFPTRNLYPALAAQQVVSTDVDSVLVGVESFTVDPAFVGILGERAEGVYDAVPGWPRASMPGYPGFAERYREAEFPIILDPDHPLAKFAPFAYDAANIIIAAIRLAAETGEVTPQSVAVAMETFRCRPHQGVIGPIQFDEFGDLLDQPFYFKRVVNGQWVDVIP